MRVYLSHPLEIKEAKIAVQSIIDSIYLRTIDPIRIESEVTWTLIVLLMPLVRTAKLELSIALISRLAAVPMPSISIRYTQQTLAISYIAVHILNECRSLIR